MGTVPAACAKPGDTVEFPLPGNAGVRTFTVAKVLNSEPKPGDITWVSPDSDTHVIGAARRITILSRQSSKESK